MYFTDTPILNRIEAIMKKLPYGTQKGGGQIFSLYKYTKKDCSCRLCLYYRKKTGCTLALCPVLDGYPAWMRRCFHWRSDKSCFQGRQECSIPKTPLSNI